MKQLVDRQYILRRLNEQIEIAKEHARHYASKVDDDNTFNKAMHLGMVGKRIGLETAVTVVESQPFEVVETGFFARLYRRLTQRRTLRCSNVERNVQRNVERNVAAGAIPRT
jgi:hypothetical protein